MSSSKTETAIRNANLQLTLKKRLADKTAKQAILRLLPKINTGSIISRSIILINQRIGQLSPISIESNITLTQKFFTNVKIPIYIIDLLRDMRLSNINLENSELLINFGEIPFEFINAVKIVNVVGGVQTINLNSTQSITFPLQPYLNSIPNVNQIIFTENSEPGDYILIIWFNAPLINLSPGYRVISNNTNLKYI